MSVKHLLAAGGVLAALLAPGPAAAAPATASPQDASFLRAAHQANLAEIAGGQVAATKGVSKQVRELGVRFVRDHTALDANLTAAAAALGVPLPTAPTPEQQALTARYRTTPPTEFDALFVATQLDAHHAAMQLGRAELATGSDPRAKEVAAVAGPVIMSHHEALSVARRDLGLGYGTPAR